MMRTRQWIRWTMVLASVLMMAACGGGGGAPEKYINIKALALSADAKTAYVVNGGQVEVLDVSDPAHIRRVGSCDKKTAAKTMHLLLSPDGKKLIIANEVHLIGAEINGGVEIYDVADPTAPRYLGGYFPGSDHDDYYGVVISQDGDTLFLANYETNNTGFQIVDIHDPEHPVLLSRFDTNGSVGLAISPDEKTAYIATRDVNTIAIVDITDTHNPVYIDPRVFTHGDVYSIVLSSDGHTAFLGEKKNFLSHSRGLEIMDVTDPRSISQIGQLSMDCPEAPKLSTDEKRFYGIYGTRLYIIDVATPTAPRLSGEFETGYDAKDRIKDFAVSDDDTKAFLANGIKGMIVLDITDPAHLSVIGEYK